VRAWKAGTVQHATSWTLATTGMRQGELRAMRRADTDLAGQRLTIPNEGHETTKRHARVIPLCNTTNTAVRDYWMARTDDNYLMLESQGRPLSSQLNTWLKPHGLRPHDLRRWAINALHGGKFSQAWIDYLVGHAPRTTDAAFYTAPSLNDLREMVALLEERLV